MFQEDQEEIVETVSRSEVSTTLTVPRVVSELAENITKPEDVVAADDDDDDIEAEEIVPADIPPPMVEIQTHTLPPQQPTVS